MIRIIMFFCLLFSLNCYALDYIKIEKQDNENGDTYRGSGIQWNNDYIVTAKHVDFIKGSVYECSQDCDLRFVKYKNIDNIKLPKWRNDLSNENLTVIGNSISGETKVVSGKSMNIKLYVYHNTLLNKKNPNSNNNTEVNLIDAGINPGQSGGPVYGRDGFLVGMAIGHTVIFDDKGNRVLVSLYIPYKIIQKEWDKFRKNQINV